VSQRIPDRRGRSVEPEGSPLRWVIAAVILGVIGFFVLERSDDETAPPAPSASASAPLLQEADGTPVAPPRCQAHGPSGGYSIGEPTSGQGGGDPLLLPFSVEVGRGVAIGRGFAVGVKRDRSGGTFHEVALLDERVENGRLLELGRSRGDLDAPLIAASGDGWVAGVLEPNAGGMALRLLRQGSDGAVQWGAEIDQGHDESLAVDLAFGSEVGVVVWDDLEDEHAVVMLAVVSPGLERRGATARVSRDEVDAELPRVIAREGGFWLAYVARRRVEGAGTSPGGGREAAERIDPSWLELLPLDRDGKAAGVPRAVTPRDGHVLAFDLAAGPEGALVIAWRDDDTPSGAHGGAAATMLVGASGEGQVQPVAEDDVGAGVPVLLEGWIALPDAQGNPRLAPLAPDGALLGELRVEPALRSAQVLAAKGDVVLAARPAGKAIELVTARCDRTLGRLPE
jgi:hypothetical protein